ncbi:glycosyltransferase family 4 protein [Candidatus Gottesmanbacteria bacterium]|nr:glycosyltransferase family 4 protein [Candidatus Gottesmanbacteria bacterium]
MNIIKQSSIILATHARVYSASQAMRDFLRVHGCRNLLYISHPLPMADVHDFDRSFAELSRGNNIVSGVRAPVRFRNVVLSSGFEALFALGRILQAGKRFDLFIGVDNMNALLGLFLKRLGIVRRVVYYTIDYFPTRFANPFMNRLYHAIDLFCVRHSDETWNVSEAMVAARRKFHRSKGEMGSQHTVPIGIWFDQVKRLPRSQINTRLIVFSGHLVMHMGVDMLIRAFADIRKKVPDASLVIVGGGEQMEALQKLTAILHLTKYVRFYGWVTDRKQLERILCRGAVGVAPFNTYILDEKVKNADPGKIKDYMVCGLPVVVTDAIASARDIQIHRCGIVVPYRKEALVRAIVRFLTDEKLHTSYRKCAISYVRRFDYNTLYTINVIRALSL